ncbi:unnamed protein product [Sympodiomycopsis kandeliae]
MADIESQITAPAEQREVGQVFQWHNIGFQIKNKENPSLNLLQSVSGQCSAGRMLAILGPSGAGKSTLLDCLAGRQNATSGQVTWGTQQVSTRRQMTSLSSYVEQADALLGVLTVEETFFYSARLSMPAMPQEQVRERVACICRGLGLTGVASNRIGTPLQRGISCGQKRRVTIGNGLVSLSPILFLDEPTSGLDSATAHEVMTTIKNLAEIHSLVVIATIHSPSWQTMQLFDQSLILAKGRTLYSGKTVGIAAYLDSIGHAVPPHVNPADHFIKLASTDFASKNECETLIGNWEAMTRDSVLTGERLMGDQTTADRRGAILGIGLRSAATTVSQTICLTNRNVLNYSRNLLAYGVRLGMYIGMGALVAAVWSNMKDEDRFINDRLSVHFFSVAFLGFMSVAGIPAFLEERAVFLRERRNGLYRAMPYVLANTVVTIPYLFVCSVTYSVIIYWSVGLHPGASHFFKFLAYLFLGVLVADFQSLLIAALVPIFVGALAIAAFANGFWMAVQGYFMRNLPHFWYVWAHWIDYQTFAFQLLVRNDFLGIDFSCETSDSGTCVCSFGDVTSTSAQLCQLSGSAVVESLGYQGVSDVLYAWILICIMVFLRMSFWIVLSLQN